jgi:single-strand DNA-binding protein
MSVNHIVLLGRVEQAPELRYTPDGQAVTRVVLHVDRPDGHGSDAIRVIARRELAETVVNLLAKGDLATAEGRVLLRTYQSRQGHRHKRAEVEADRIQRVAADTASG